MQLKGELPKLVAAVGGSSPAADLRRTVSGPWVGSLAARYHQHSASYWE